MNSINQSIARANVFQKLIHPIDHQLFFQVYYEREFVKFLRNDKHFYADILDTKDIENFLSKPNLAFEIFRVISNGHLIKRSSYAEQFGFVKRGYIKQKLKEGSTVVIDSGQMHFDRLQQFHQLLFSILGFPLIANIYITPPNSQGFNTHTDSHDVFILQIAGSKTWRVYEPVKPFCLREETLEMDTSKTNLKLIESIDIQQGDMLYIPRGFPHDARATGMPSVHISLGLHPLKWIDLIKAIALKQSDNDFLKTSLPTWERGRIESDFGRTVKRLSEIFGSAVFSSDYENGIQDKYKHCKIVDDESGWFANSFE